MKDILLVAHDPVNVVEMVRRGITSYKHMTFDFIDPDAIRAGFRYKGFGHRARNFYLKNVTGRNLKLEYYSNSVKKAIEVLQPSYKIILVIRPDLLNDEHLDLLRGMTSHMVACCWDTVDFFPRKLATVSYFDRVFSFDPDDCRKYGFEFRPNFYCYENSSPDTDYNVYNLSSFDERRKAIEEVAICLRRTGASHLFKGYHRKPFSNQYIKHTFLITYQQMISEAARGDAILDITKKGQKGLSLRPFEALGLNRKLITNNPEVRGYEFYHPDNVFIIEPGKSCPDRSFFEKPYTPIPEGLKARYHISQWISDVLSV